MGSPHHVALMNGSGEKSLSMLWCYRDCLWIQCMLLVRISYLFFPLNQTTVCEQKKPTGQALALPMQRKHIWRTACELLMILTKWKHDTKTDLKRDIHFQDFETWCATSTWPSGKCLLWRTYQRHEITVHHKVEGDEKMKVVDFTTLDITLAYVNTFAEYPIHGVGHLQIITENYFRTCSVNFNRTCIANFNRTCIATKRTRLPRTSRGKRRFTCCATCAVNEPCTCTDDQRTLIRTWCIPAKSWAEKQGYVMQKIYHVSHLLWLELGVFRKKSEALKQGYVLQTIYYVHHFENTAKYDRATKQGGHLAEYVDTFLTIKQEASR